MKIGFTEYISFQIVFRKNWGLFVASYLSRQVVVNLIGNTTTEAGLYIKSALDENHYDQGIKVSDDELATLAIERDGFHGEWNYRLRPKNQ